MNKDKESIIKDFCDLVGIKAITAYKQNTETGELKLYSNVSSLYKKLKGWNEENTTYCRLGKPIYPNLLEPENFLTLLNIQWNIFGKLGQSYIKTKEDESFEENYLINRFFAIKMCQSLGGGEMLDKYLKTLSATPWTYDLEEEC